MAKVKNQPDSFFIRVADPIELRRNILESSRMLILSLQRYERYKQLMHEKLKGISTLNQTIKEIQALMTKLKNEIPKTNKQTPPMRQTKKEVSLKEKEAPVVKSELEKLEEELSHIEGKLKDLS